MISSTRPYYSYAPLLRFGFKPTCRNHVLLRRLTRPSDTAPLPGYSWLDLVLSLVAIILCCSCIESTSHAQQVSAIAQSGTSIAGSYQPGDIDTINLQNGAVILNIPVLSYPQLGNKLKLSFSLKYSPAFWFYVAGPDNTASTSPGNRYTGEWSDSNPNYSLPVGVTLTRDQALVATTLQLTYPCSSNAGACPPPQNGSQEAEEQQYVNLYSLTTADRAVHDFGLNDNNNHYFVLPTLDGSNYLPVGSGSTLPSTYLGADGVRYDQVASSAGSALSGFNQTDPDGNTITMSGTGWVDSIGRQIPGAVSGPGDGHPTRSTGGEPIPGVVSNDLSKCAAGTTAARLWNVPGSGSSTPAYVLCFTPISANTNFATYNYQPSVNSSYATDPNGQGTGSYLLLTQLILPNNTSYSFTYDSYLELQSLTLPTGATISYQWFTNEWATADIARQQSRMVQSRTVANTDGSSYTWTYTYTYAGPANVPYGTPTASALITDPNGNDELHSYSTTQAPSGANEPTETIASYNGTGQSRILLKTVTIVRPQFVNPIVYPFGAPPILGPPVSQTTSWAGANLTSQILTTLTPASGSYYSTTSILTLAVLSSHIPSLNKHAPSVGILFKPRRQANTTMEQAR